MINYKKNTLEAPVKLRKCMAGEPRLRTPEGADSPDTGRALAGLSLVRLDSVPSSQKAASLATSTFHLHLHARQTLGPHEQVVRTYLCMSSSPPPSKYALLVLHRESGLGSKFDE